ncbi:MAG: NUDIX domain-containing protein [Gemmatimonadetes bacterium]|nr:NUDIX domain-containing protein [Gemmatimonadota bacterium]
MTELRVGVVDVYPVEHGPTGWRVLLLERAEAARSPGAWEVVHGRIEAGEAPPAAAVRELAEETGLAPARLYSISSHPFYVASVDTVFVAVTFAAMVSAEAPLHLGSEHTRGAWLPFAEAAERATWPRAEEHLRWIARLLRDGSAGPAEDVLRIV